MLVFPGEDFKYFQEMILRIPQSNFLLCNSSLQRVSKRKIFWEGSVLFWSLFGVWRKGRIMGGKREEEEPDMENDRIGVEGMRLVPQPRVRVKKRNYVFRRPGRSLRP